MRQKAVIVGAGGHSKVVLDILEQTGDVEIIGFISAEGFGEVCGYPVIGNDTVLESLSRQGVQAAMLAVGDNRRRAVLFEVLQSHGFRLLNAISPHASISSKAQLGRGVAAMPGSIVNAGAQIGDGVILNTNSAVDHDCRIARFAHIGPGSTLAGGVTVEEGAFLTTGTCVIPNVTIGCWTCLGAGAVAVRDLPPDITAIGIPAEPVPHEKRRR